MGWKGTGISREEEERLALLAEECGEVIQVIGKILRHGYRSVHPAGGANNRELLQQEMGHAMYAIGLMCEAGDVDADEVAEEVAGKAERVVEYLHYNAEVAERAAKKIEEHRAAEEEICAAIDERKRGK